MKKYLTEGIGTFFLVLTLVLTNNNGAGALAPLAVGSILIAMIYAGSHISGAHFNPAVSLAMLMRGKIDRIDFTYYVLAQVAGGALAAFLGVFLLGCMGATEIRPHQNQALCSIMAEFLGAFALTYVVLQVMNREGDQQSSFFGLACGFTYMAAIYGLGAISGGAFNPAVAIGMALSGMASWADLWIYFVGALLGAAVAATTFQLMMNDE